MLKRLDQDSLGNIAEYVNIPRKASNINSIGILDRTLLERIRQYNPNFSYSIWKHDLEEKNTYMDKDLANKYHNRVGQIQYDIIIHKPDNIANILSTPDTLEEYLNRLIRYNKSPYRLYYEMLTGDWSIEIPQRSDETVKIITNDFLNLHDTLQPILENTSISLSYKFKAVGLYPHDTDDRSELLTLIRGIMDMVDIVYPIRE